MVKKGGPRCAEKETISVHVIFIRKAEADTSLTYLPTYNNCINHMITF